MPDAIDQLTAALADRYVIERELGAGGMATVYLARDLRHDREVALKVLRPELSAVLGAERFLNEIRISARLDHPHILTLIDSGDAGGLLWYVLPYVRGESLRQRLERERQLGVEDALRIARQVATALEYAHRQGVVHRDVKPENILLHEGEAVVADFGIALALREAGGSRLTETGLSLGTPQYMSPEQATGDRQLDARSDVYSLAAVLYEMLAGEPPVTGPSVQAVIAKLLTERPTSVRVLRDTVPPKVDQAIMRALAKVPADRFPSAAAFAEMLQVAPDSAAAPAKPRRRVLLAGTGLAVAAGAVALTAWLARGTGNDAPLLDPPRAQFTFTGTASVPAVSPDGQRVAYAARECDGAGRCTEAIVWQDRGGAGMVRTAEGLAAVYDLRWSSDARYLRFIGTDAEARYGVFVVPALGGPLRHHAALQGEFLGGSDTLVLVRPKRPASSDTVQLAVVAARDGVVRDSISIPVGKHEVGTALPSPSHQLLAVVTFDPAGADRDVRVRLIRRDGTLLDSTALSRGTGFLTWDPRGDALLAGVTDSTEPSTHFVERYRLDPRRGRFTGQPERLLRFGPAPEPVFDVSQTDRTLAYAAGNAEYVVYAITGDDAARSPAERRAVSTATTSAEISPSGRWISLLQRSGGSGARWQVSIMPFDSGPPVPLGAAHSDLWHMEWSPAEDRLFYVVGEDTHARIVEADPVTRRIRDVGRADLTVPPSDFEPLHAGGFAWPAVGGRALRFLQPDGARREVSVPGLDIIGLSDSPHGHGLAVVAWRRPLLDSLVIGVLDPASGAVDERYVGTAEGAAISWLPNGDIRMLLRETLATSVMHILPAGGGPPVRRELMPIRGTYRYTPDGSRATVSAIEERRDVWLIPNFDGRVVTADGSR